MNDTDNDGSYITAPSSPSSSHHMDFSEDGDGGIDYRTPPPPPGVQGVIVSIRAIKPKPRIPPSLQQAHNHPVAQNSPTPSPAPPNATTDPMSSPPPPPLTRTHPIRYRQNTIVRVVYVQTPRRGVFSTLLDLFGLEYACTYIGRLPGGSKRKREPEDSRVAGQSRVDAVSSGWLGWCKRIKRRAA